MAAEWYGGDVKSKEILIQLQNHRAKVGPATLVLYDEFTDQDGTLRCVLYSGERAAA